MTTNEAVDVDPRVAESILESVQIPTLPEAALNLLILCRDPYVGSADIVRIIELDPALSARLLKVANSSFFGQQYLVSTLTRAAVVLGNEHLKAAAMGFFLAKGWDNLGHAGFDHREFWRDNILRGCLGRQLAHATDLHPAEQAFLIDMLGDVGTLVMVTYFGKPYMSVLQECRGDFVRRGRLERETFHTDHASVAETLARRWRFPEILATALGRRCVEPPSTRTNDPAVLLWQLSYFCAAVPFAADRQTAKLKESLRMLALGAFGLSFEALCEVFAGTVEQYNVLRNVFSNLSPAECNAEDLLAGAAAVMGTLDPEITTRVNGGS